MKKDDFLKLGLDDAAAVRCASASAEELKGFIPKSRFDEVNSEKKLLEQNRRESDAALEKLNKYADEVKTLKTQIVSLKQENQKLVETHTAEIHAFKVNAAVDAALVAARAKNLTAVKALLNVPASAKLDKNGNVIGLSEQIDSIKLSDGYLFFSDKPFPQCVIKGAVPGESGNEFADEKADLSRLTYSQLAAYLERNPHTNIL